MKFREHRGGLEESMKTVVEVNSLNELVDYCHKLLDPFGIHHGKVSIQEYVPDERIGWKKQYFVIVEGYGVMGFIDADPLESRDKTTDHKGESLYPYSGRR